jgi:ribonuclease D
VHPCRPRQAWDSLAVFRVLYTLRNFSHPGPGVPASVAAALNASRAAEAREAASAAARVIADAVITDVVMKAPRSPGRLRGGGASAGHGGMHGCRGTEGFAGPRERG